MNHSFVDQIFLVTAVAFNLLTAGVYIAARHRKVRWIRRIGWVFISLALPFSIVLVATLTFQKPSWISIILYITLVYILVELLFDFILKIDFRRKPVLHIPYLILFYTVLFGLIGIAFSIERSWGWLVSISFWLLLASLIYMLLGRKANGYNLSLPE